MANRSKQKGTDAENKVRDLFKTVWPETERRAQEGCNDKGDLINVPRTCVEVKSCKAMTLGPWLKEAEAERARLQARWGLVVHKRVGTTDPAAWFATMDGATALDLIRLANQALDAEEGRPRRRRAVRVRPGTRRS